MTAVFITGASGFIAQHIIKQLLEKNYKVVGTVRSVEKGERLKKSFDSISPGFTYEIVKDIAAKDGLKDALQKHPDVEVFLHTASPFHFDTNDPEKDLLIPAKNGTLYTLDAIHRFAPQIKQVVITSSYAAMAPGKKEMDPNYTLTEKSWNNVQWYQAKRNPVFGYFGSKKFAEEVAWQFQKENGDTIKFNLNVVNPSYVFGPQAFDSEVVGKDSLNTSSEIINAIIKLGPNENLPYYVGSFIDVRDVARAHILAFENEKIRSERLLLASTRYATQDILDIVNENFPKDLKGKLPVGTPGTGGEETSKYCKIDNSRTRELLGFDFISLKDSVVDSVHQLLKAQHPKSKL